jgi:DNA polymerase-4/DNA polymerase V
MRRALRSSYETIAANMQKEISRELGLTVSVGLSLTKVLAKAASKHRKPCGLTIIPGRSIAAYLQGLPAEKIWGIGPATASYLLNMGIRTALEFARLPEEIVRKRFTKPGIEIWRELRGESVYPVAPGEKSVYASISKMKTFAPPTSDPEYLFAHLLRNLESACIKARRYTLAARKIIPILKRQDFASDACELRLSRPSSQPLDLSGPLRGAFAGLFRERALYRATGIILLDLVPDVNCQYSLFEDPVEVEKIRDLYQAVDEISGKYGKHTLHLGGSHAIEIQGQGRRGKPTAREQTRFFGETKRQHLGLPLLHLPR